MSRIGSYFLTRNDSMITEVGKQFIPGKSNWPEGAIFEYTETGPILILAFNNPTDKEIEGAKSGTIEMAYYESRPVLFVCVKIQGCGGWLDAPFSIRLYENKIFDWSEEISEGTGLAIQIILLDARTGIVKSQRLIGAATDFSRGLRAAITRQYEQPFSREAYNRQIDTVYRNYSSDDIAHRADSHFRIKREG